MLQRNAQYNIRNAIMMAATFTLINQYVGIFAVKLGATDLQLGYLSSWPNLASVLAVLGAGVAVARVRNKQRAIAAIFLLGRTAALGAAAIPWFPESVRVWVLIGFWVLSVFPQSAAGTAMQSFLADVFPGTAERGKAFAARNAWTTGAGMLIIPMVGWGLDNLFPYPLGYQVMFTGTFFLALIEIFYFLRMRVPEEKPQAAAPAPASPVERIDWRTYLRTFSHRPFRLFVLCSIPFHFCWQIAWPIFTRYQVTDMGLNNLWMSWLGVANQAGQVLTFGLWGLWAERFGTTRMLGFAALNIATAPFLTAAAPSAIWLLPVNVWTGMGVAGVVLLVLNNQLEVSPIEGRPIFLAVHMALVSIGATIAPLVGAFLMSAMPARTALYVSTIPRLLTAVGFFVVYGYSKGEAGRKAFVSES